MKKFVMLAIVMVMLFALPAVAMASGWVDPTANPHTGWTAATNKCKACHAVHEAENVGNTLNGEKLLRSTVVGACDYCHVSANFAGIQKVYNADPANYALDTGKEHTLSSTVATDAPDSGDAAGLADPATDYAFAQFGCVSCHSVHGAGTFQAGANILKANPYTGDADAATTMTQFCTDCHDNNYVTLKDTGAAGVDQVSHYMGAAVKGQSIETSADCRNCHDGGVVGAAGNSWPHLTSGWNFLADASTSNLDTVCLSCHTTVGTAY
ncbi:MAG: multiheme c-type cytochrome [Coriobacteriia bacterium]